jgi:hypothetical protein
MHWRAQYLVGVAIALLLLWSKVGESLIYTVLTEIVKDHIPPPFFIMRIVMLSTGRMVLRKYVLMIQVGLSMAITMLSVLVLVPGLLQIIMIGMMCCTVIVVARMVQMV